MDNNPSQLRKQAVKARQLWGRTRDPYVRQMLTFLANQWEAQAKELRTTRSAPHRRAPGRPPMLTQTSVFPSTR